MTSLASCIGHAIRRWCRDDLVNTFCCVDRREVLRSVITRFVLVMRRLRIVHNSEVDDALFVRCPCDVIVLSYAQVTSREWRLRERP